MDGDKKGEGIRVALMALLNSDVGERV